jgi:hypothetical protein
MITHEELAIAEATLAGRVNPEWLEEVIRFYAPLSLENLQRLLWEELSMLLASNNQDDAAAETANAIRAVMALRRAG